MHVEEILTTPKDISLHVDLDSPCFSSAQYEEIKAVVRSEPSKFPDLSLFEPHLYYRSVPKDSLTEESPWKLWLPTGLVSTIIERAHVPPLSAHR